MRDNSDAEDDYRGDQLDILLAVVTSLEKIGCLSEALDDNYRKKILDALKSDSVDKLTIMKILKGDHDANQ